MHPPSSAGVPVVLHYHGGVTETVLISPEIEYDRQAVHISRDGVPAEVPFSELKAIFFVRTSADPAEDAITSGKLLTVEFRDGELIRGYSAEYHPERNGFFLFPADRSKNERVFVVNSAIVSIEVEKF